MTYYKNGKKIPLKLNIHFFDGEKTEEATSKKKRDSRREGQVAKSEEISTAIMLIVMFFSLKTFAGYMYNGLAAIFTYNLDVQIDYNATFNETFLGRYVAYAFARVILIVAPLFAVAMVLGILTNVMQVGWEPTTKPLKPKFSKLNPISGFKKIFSLKAIVTLIKSVVKLSIIVFIVFNYIKDRINIIPILFQLEISEILMFLGETITGLGITVGAYYIFIALGDYVYTKFKHKKDMRMSKQEIKDEYKNSEGDPQVKGRIKQKMREAAMRRMMSDLPSADVIITNPTHYAVAIKYDRATSPAPIVVGKGVDHMAKRIREVATEHNIEIVENKPLARTLYSTVEIGEEIPPELYKTVAEILAYVYKLKGQS